MELAKYFEDFVRSNGLGQPGKNEELFELFTDAPNLDKERQKFIFDFFQSFLGKDYHIGTESKERIYNIDDVKHSLDTRKISKEILFLGILLANQEYATIQGNTESRNLAESFSNFMKDRSFNRLAKDLHESYNFIQKEKLLSNYKKLYDLTYLKLGQEGFDLMKPSVDKLIKRSFERDVIFAGGQKTSKVSEEYFKNLVDSGSLDDPRVKATLTEVRELMVGRGFSTQAAEAVKHVPNVEAVVDIDEEPYSFSSRSIKNIISLKKLKEIDYFANDIDIDRSIFDSYSEDSLSGVETLMLEGESSELTIRLPKLKTIGMSAGKILNRDRLDKCQSLESISLFGVDLPVNEHGNTTVVANLKNIALDEKSLENRSPVEVQQEKISLVGLDLGDTTIDQILASSPKLKTLVLSNCSVKGNLFGPNSGKFENLERIVLSGTKLDQQTIDSNICPMLNGNIITG